MAPGVKKTYIKQYRQNLRKAIELLVEDIDLDDNLDNVFKTLEEEYHLVPTISENEEYKLKESEYLKELLNDKDIIEKVQKFAENNGYKDTNKRTFQAMEALIHNLNTMHSRAGAQIPFSSINYGMDTSPEGRMVIKNLLLTTEEGLGNGETPIFPIQIFKVKEGINYNLDDPNYDLFKLACRVSAKRLFPNFSFIDAPFNLKYYKEGCPETEVAYMGCRTRVIGNVYDSSREIVSGRGNLSFTTINLPRIGIKNRNDIQSFYKELDETMDLVITQLIERFEIQASKKVSNFPFLMGQGIWMDSEKLLKDEEIREVLKHGTLSIGFIGLAECLKALIGSHHGESKEAQALGLEIVKYMRDRMDDISQQYKMNFTLIGTPAEGTAGRFVKMDKEIYGDIPGVTSREYYTNSFHVPVYYNTRAIHKINTEAPYHELTNAGHITYVELDGDPSQNLDAFEKIVRAMKEAGIGYGSINHPVDRDPVCGYTGIIGDICPQCGREEGSIKFDRIRRITGYLVGTLDRFNDAKRAEERDRIKHFSCSKI
jgi:ribonucleoside-triphosphate reductase